MGASCPHLKLEISRATRFGCRAVNFAAHTLWLVLQEYEFFQASPMSSGWLMTPARTSSPNSRSSMSSSSGRVFCEKIGYPSFWNSSMIS